jgi:ornithine--oxo-acid transaminase
MASERPFIDEQLVSSTHLSKRHVHPKLSHMMELGGMNTVFARAAGQYLYDLEGNRYLDLLSGGGVHFAGRNHPKILEALREATADHLPNLCVVNASILGGALAERLLNLAGDHSRKVLFANSGAEAVDSAMRFARYVSRRTRFLYLDGAFHGRTWGAISVNGFEEMREGLKPFLPDCRAIPPNDPEALKREIARGDVAAFIVEPVQGMTLTPLDPEYMRTAERLCRRFGTLLIADEIQTGLARCGVWFVSTDHHQIRPDLITVGKVLSGGMVPVSAVLISNDVYKRFYDKFASRAFFMSSYAENNLAMSAGIATLDVLTELDAPRRAAELSRRFRCGFDELAQKYDVIDRTAGMGLMLGVYFKDSTRLALKVQQRLLAAKDKSAFGAAVNVALYARRSIVHVPGPGQNAIKILPPVVCTDADVDFFLECLSDTLHAFYGSRGPLVTLGGTFAKSALQTLRGALQEGRTSDNRS